MGAHKAISPSKYLALTKAGIMEALSFRTNALVTILGNIVYLIIIYFLWRAIYASSPTTVVNGMSFQDTMIYLVLATAMCNFMECFIVWAIGRNYQTGQIVLDLLRPMDFQLYYFFGTSGNYVMSFVTTFLPTFLIIYFVTHGAIPLGWNLLVFGCSMVMSVIINFCVDFFVGVICFYTQSIWGINVMKQVIVALLSGAAIPLAFFPGPLRTFVHFLPFQAIYNTPLQILTDETLVGSAYLDMLGSQMFWMVVMIILSRYFWKISQKMITVNGG